MAMLTKVAAWVLPGLLQLALIGACQAGSIQLTPVQIDLSAAARVAVLTVLNTGEDESVMQVTLNKWTHDGQHYVYEQSQDLVVTPATFRLAPGKQQIVRIGLRAIPPTDGVELAYRLLVEEVPQPSSSSVTGAQLVVRHDLPVFVAPTRAAKSILDASIDCAADGAKLRLANIGNVHAKVLSVVLEATPAMQVVGRWDTFEYLLPSAKKSWELSKLAPEAVGKPLQVTLITDQGSFVVGAKSDCR